ncbi:MAG: prephenate dehydrogenase/arogenate dehydrogenase family protein, partial [Candidatus Moranbacteria bacterium]|nr:prephenate dehydrogenase/arogenate dehydrogenase family protein [Candidatus Moranbacteria bacterium]
VYLINSHPMWGPESYSANNGLKDLKIVLHPLRIPKTLFKEIKSKLKKAGFKLIVQTPKEHDRDAANSQALAQFVGKILQKMPAKEVKISTLGFERLKSLMPFVVKNTEELFYSLQNYNPYAQQARERFLKTADKLHFDIEQKKLK